MSSERKIRIDGFRMPHEALKEFLEIRDKAFDRPKASAYVTYLTMLKQMDIEKKQRGILKDYSLSYWSKELGIPYSSLYAGKQYLIYWHFIEETTIKGEPVLLIKGMEKWTNPTKSADGKTHINYFIIPNALFKTNILAEFVRTSNPEAIELMFSLLNQFRVAIGKSEDEIILSNIKQERLMSTLKKKLNKPAWRVREILGILEPLFNIEYVGVTRRKYQLWVKKVVFSLKEDCVKVQSEEDFNVDHLMAMMSHELTYFLDGMKFRYRPKDQVDIMLSFKQEILNKVKFIPDSSNFKLNEEMKILFLKAMDSFGEYVTEERRKRKHFRILSLGASFRMVFRKHLSWFVKQIPRGVFIDAITKYQHKHGCYPEIANLRK